MWGQHLILDLKKCNKAKISDADNILAWLRELVPAIDMKAVGEPILEHFAVHSNQAAGYTLLQLIETSNICVHFAENLGEAYIDVFSCKTFDAEVVKEMCRKYFEAGEISTVNLMRG